MPTISLYFPDTFADENWRGITYLLESPLDDFVNGQLGEWVIGRLPTSHLTIAIKNVSRRHASIVYSYAADRWSLQDLGSDSGTFLNGKKLKPGDLMPLAIGDRIYLGPNLMTVVEDEQDTVGTNSDLDTVASLTPIDYRPPPPPPPAPPPTPPPAPAPPAPPPPRGLWDNVYFVLSWCLSASTPLGVAYRVIILALAVAVVIIVWQS